MRVLVLSIILLAAGVTLLPEASAICEPNPVINPDFCGGHVPTPEEKIRSVLCAIDPSQCYY